MSHKELIKQFFTLQEERVKTYRTFDSGFKEYLESAPDYDFPSYRQLVHDITQKFNKISSDVITIETKFREEGYTSIAELIRKIQLKEKEKLELTAQFQIAQQNSASDPSNESKADETTEVKLSLQKLVDLIVELLEELKYEAEDILLEDT